MAATQISLTGHCVSWVTPLGLPITQPYHRETTEEVQTPVQNVALTTMFDPTKKPNLSKQKGGFAPNFIHSLDSCHMMLTSLFCQRARLTFASVHDSFWTHPQTVPMMNKVGEMAFFTGYCMASYSTPFASIFFEWFLIMFQVLKNAHTLI